MKYSIQNAFGDVYGLFEIPRNGQSTEVWVCELKDELQDILGLEGVKKGLLSKAEGEDRIVIDIEPSFDEEETQDRLARVHATVGSLATLHKPNFE